MTFSSQSTTIGMASELLSLVTRETHRHWNNVSALPRETAGGPHHSQIQYLELTYLLKFKLMLCLLISVLIL